MDKLQYDSLYKFLVSLGVVLIALPITALIFLVNGTMHIISKLEYENLSEYSIQNLKQHEYIVALITKVLPIASILFFASGIVLILIGLIKWQKIQNILDAQIIAETKIKELEVEKMSTSEILNDHLGEIEAVSETTPPTTEIAPIYVSQHQRLLKSLEIEDKFFAYGIPDVIKRRYVHKRNIRIGNYSYDAIGVSLTTKVDYIYEVKYWDRIPPNPIIEQAIEKLYKSAVQYKELEERRCRCILAIICPKDILEAMMRRIDSFLEKRPELNYKEININCISEDSLKE